MTIAAGRKNGPIAMGLIAMIFETTKQVTNRPVRAGKNRQRMRGGTFSLIAVLSLKFRIHRNTDAASNGELGGNFAPTRRQGADYIV